MPGAELNNIKSKLDGMQDVPGGYLFNQDQVWHGLEAKLQKKKSKTRLSWIYAAAMIVALGVVSSFLFRKHFTTENNKGVKTISVREAESKSTVNLVQGGHEIDRVEKINNLKPQPKKDVALSHMIRVAPIEVRSIVPEGESVTNNAEVALNPDTVKAVVSVTPQKPKFKIAHVNELRNADQITSQQNAVINSIAYKKPILSTVSEEPLNSDEKLITRKKSKNILSVFSSSQ